MARNHEALNLHDARVLSVDVREKNYVERDVVLRLDTRGAMTHARALRLVRCVEIEMDMLSGCWWMGETISGKDGRLLLQADLVTAGGQGRRLRVVCDELMLEK